MMAGDNGVGQGVEAIATALAPEPLTVELRVIAAVLGD